MIAPTMAIRLHPVPQTGRGIMRLTDLLRDEAALELADALDGVTVKQVQRANVDGVGATYLSRAKSGDSCNPLFRIAGLFLMMKRLGMGRARAQRIVDWMQELIDAIWPPQDLPPLDEVLDEEQDLDAADDPHQQRIGRDPEAMRRMLEAKRRQHAHDRTVILALRRAVARLAA